jgi:hypothetical protein
LHAVVRAVIHARCAIWVGRFCQSEDFNIWSEIYSHSKGFGFGFFCALVPGPGAGVSADVLRICTAKIRAKILVIWESMDGLLVEHRIRFCC